MELVARQDERRAIDQMVAEAAAGRGGSLVVAGEAGIGKSTLIDAATAALDEHAVLRTSGAEFEQDLLYAALYQLCAPVLDRRGKLPAVQREALEAVFGLGEQTSPEPLTVGLAVLGLLHEVARKRPVCCVVDDAQWIDDASRQVLVFVARRVEAERIAVVFAARDAATVPGLAALPRLPLAGLSHEDARRLLGTVTRSGLDAELVERILAEAAGNPLALLEFAHDDGPFGVPRARPSLPRAGTVLEAQFVHRFEQLPPDTRSVVVLAAAEPVGDLALLRRAARLLKLDPEALSVAEDAGLLELGPQLRFRHPLVRSALYTSATPGLRRRVHGALAEATDPATDPDRQVWHRAHAVVEADENVASELERSAERARVRGGFAAAAAFMERAAQLTPGTGRQSGRLIAAARLRLQAGSPATARTLVARAELRLKDHRRTQARLLRARIDFQLGHTPQATAALIDIAAQLPPDQAREVYLEAFASIMYNDNQPGLLKNLGAALRKQDMPRHPARPVDLLLQALMDQITLPVEEAVPAMLGAVTACRTSTGSFAGSPWRMNLVCQLILDLRDDKALREVTDRQVEAARSQGSLSTLPQALRYQALSRIAGGSLTEADGILTEAHALDEAAGTVRVVGVDLILAAFRGDAYHYSEVKRLMGRDGQPSETAGEQFARAVLHNGLGNHEAALQAALAAQSRQQAGSYAIWGVYPELVEAAVRVGRPQEAAAAVHLLESLAHANPAPWAVAECLRAKALVGRDENRDALYREAVDYFARTGAHIYHARARLVYGEWLDSEGRPGEARVELRAAQKMLSAMGADAFAERAARRLRAAGERPGPQDSADDPLGVLTARERLIVNKVAEGGSSREVAAALFLSPRTVDTHLHNAYRKLGISSRQQLRKWSS
ncbi:AAA family ATPase [Streptomyces flavofungini]|uniref:AAA family ATPase n=1 Tax=Streptomyces flavofungini TaxID=68200 RepID=A0ABS0X897_9ACTN|nr:LuxR family transcriptional regulator [Streptomyces flavofungini]MBJ3809425.1 AAA family ATPase [Streptomyces flavofungini]